MKKLMKAGLFILGLAILALGLVIVCARPATSSPAKQALALLDRGGGTDNVRGEAQQLFRRFGVTNVTALSDPELQDFHAISSLGGMRGIYPGSLLIFPFMSAGIWMVTF